MTALYDAVLEVVPRLRRYGWLLAGSREVGDDYAQSCLERLLHAPFSVDHGTTARDVFALLHRVISDAEIRLDTSVPPGASRLEQELLALPVEQRKAVLLVHVEGFSPRDAAWILRQPAAELEASLAQGRRQLRRNLSASVFIIEDEFLVALDISRLVEEFGHNVCGMAARGGDAICAIEVQRPALVLADVQLGDGEADGIDACERFRSRENMEIIYVTGYPDRVRKKLKRNGVLVVPKPVQRETLRQVMGRALGFVA